MIKGIVVGVILAIPMWLAGFYLGFAYIAPLFTGP